MRKRQDDTNTSFYIDGDGFDVSYSSYTGILTLSPTKPSTSERTTTTSTTATATTNTNATTNRYRYKSKARMRYWYYMRDKTKRGGRNTNKATSSTSTSQSSSLKLWEIQLKEILWDLPSKIGFKGIEVKYSTTATSSSSSPYPDELLDILQKFIHDVIPAYQKQKSSPSSTSARIMTKSSTSSLSNFRIQFSLCAVSTSDDDVDYQTILESNHRLLQVVTSLPSCLQFTIELNHNSGAYSSFFCHAIKVLSACVQLNPDCLETFSIKSYDYGTQTTLPHQDIQRQQRLLLDDFHTAMALAKSFKTFELEIYRAMADVADISDIFTWIVLQTVSQNTSLQCLSLHGVRWPSREEFDEFLLTVLDHSQIKNLAFAHTGYTDIPTRPAQEQQQQQRQNHQERASSFRLLPALCTFLSHRDCKISSLALHSGMPRGSIRSDDLDLILSCLWKGHPMRHIEVRYGNIDNLDLPMFFAAMENGTATTDLECLNLTGNKFPRTHYNLPPAAAQQPEILDDGQSLDGLSQSLLYMLEKLPNFCPIFSDEVSFIEESPIRNKLQFLLDRNRTNQQVEKLVVERRQRRREGREEEVIREKGKDSKGDIEYSFYDNDDAHFWCHVIGNIINFQHDQRRRHHARYRFYSRCYPILLSSLRKNQANQIYRLLYNDGAFVSLICQNRYLPFYDDKKIRTAKSRQPSKHNRDNHQTTSAAGTTNSHRMVHLVGKDGQQQQQQQHQKNIRNQVLSIDKSDTDTDTMPPVYEVVSFQCASQRFEILCYASELCNYRERQRKQHKEKQKKPRAKEQNWDEIKSVLASYRIYRNVEQRVYVPEKVLKKTIGRRTTTTTTPAGGSSKNNKLDNNELEIASFILQHGMTMSERIESKLIEMAKWLSENCIRKEQQQQQQQYNDIAAKCDGSNDHDDRTDPSNYFSVQDIRNAMNEIDHLHVHLSKPPSAQCDKWLEVLEPILPMIRKTNGMHFMLYPFLTVEKQKKEERGYDEDEKATALPLTIGEVEYSVMEVFLDDRDIVWKKLGDEVAVLPVDTCQSDREANLSTITENHVFCGNYRYRLELNQRQYTILDKHVRKQDKTWILEKEVKRRE